MILEHEKCAQKLRDLCVKSSDRSHLLSCHKSGCLHPKNDVLQLLSYHLMNLQPPIMSTA